jgi:hypothetical protein
MKTSKKRKQTEDSIVLLPQAEEDDDRDLSWMIRDYGMPEKPAKRSPKRKKK